MALGFGDGVWVTQADGSEIQAIFLTGPWNDGENEVISVCDLIEWSIATEREGRDPKGQLYPAVSVRPFNGWIWCDGTPDHPPNEGKGLFHPDQTTPASWRWVPMQSQWCLPL